MKSLVQLTRQEKVDFLKRVKAGEIHPNDLTEPPVFLTKPGDTFIALMQGCRLAIPITPEAIRDAEEVNNAINGR